VLYIIPRMTHWVSGGTLNHAHSLTLRFTLLHWAFGRKLKYNAIEKCWVAICSSSSAQRTHLQTSASTLRPLHLAVSQ